MNSSIVADFESGMSLTAISKTHKVCRRALSLWLNNHGLRSLQPVGFSQTTMHNPNIFDTIDCPKKAYWLGFILADGSISDTRFVVALQKRDKDHVQRCASFFSSKRSITETSNSWRYTVRSKQFVTGLKKHGIIAKAEIITGTYENALIGSLFPNHCEILYEYAITYE